MRQEEAVDFALQANQAAVQNQRKQIVFPTQMKRENLWLIKYVPLQAGVIQFVGT